MTHVIVLRDLCFCVTCHSIVLRDMCLASPMPRRVLQLTRAAQEIEDIVGEEVVPQ